MADETKFYLTVDGARRVNGRSRYHGVRRLGTTGSLVTACSGLHVAEEYPSTASSVTPVRRCRASGCKQRWDAALGGQP